MKFRLLILFLLAAALLPRFGGQVKVVAWVACLNAAPERGRAENDYCFCELPNR
jgi:hypothetical protein